MSFASRFNRTRLFDYDTEGFDYVSLEQLYLENGDKRIYPVHAIYINTKSLYDDSPVFALDDVYVNIPAHMTEICQEILQDETAIDDINAGKVGIKIYKYYQKKYSRDCYNVEFVDIK